MSDAPGSSEMLAHACGASPSGRSARDQTSAFCGATAASHSIGSGAAWSHVKTARITRMAPGEVSEAAVKRRGDPLPSATRRYAASAAAEKAIAERTTSTGRCTDPIASTLPAVATLRRTASALSPASAPRLVKRARLASRKAQRLSPRGASVRVPRGRALRAEALSRRARPTCGARPPPVLLPVVHDKRIVASCRRIRSGAGACVGSHSQRGL